MLSLLFPSVCTLQSIGVMNNKEACILLLSTFRRKRGIVKWRKVEKERESKSYFLFYTHLQFTHITHRHRVAVYYISNVLPLLEVQSYFKCVLLCGAIED